MCPRNAVTLPIEPDKNQSRFMPDLTFLEPDRTVKSFNIRLTQNDIENLNIIRGFLKCTNYSIAIRTALDNLANYYRNKPKK